MMLSTELIVIIVLSVLSFVFLLTCIIVIVLRRRYKLNWYQWTLLETSDLETSKPCIVKQQIPSHGARDSSSSDDDEDGGIDNPALSDKKNVIFTAGPEEEEPKSTLPSFLSKLSKHVNFIQPPGKAHERGALRGEITPTMGGDESRLSSSQSPSRIKGVRSTGRRYSAPVIYGKINTDVLSTKVQSQLAESLAAHTKLKATHSVPYSAAGVPLLESQQEEEEDENDSQQTFTLPLQTDEFQSIGSKARLARRRTSMQDSIDMTHFNPALYKSLDRAPTIREEPSIDVHEPIGILYLTVCITSDTGLLKVTLHKADLTGFPTTQLQLRNPYFHVFVVGVNSSGRQTKPSDNSLHPIIDETFLFEVGDDLSGKKLVCHLYDYDQFVKTDKIGFVQLRLNTIPRNEKMSVQKHIDRCEGDCHTHDEQYVGEILFSISYNKQTERLTLVITKAKDLHIEDELAVLGLMVKVTVLHQGRRIKKKRTENVKLSTKPSWNEAIVLNLTTLQLSDISITVDVCKDRLSGSEVIGRVQISEHGDKKESNHWSEIQASTNQNTSLEWWHQLKCIDKVH